MAADAFTTSSPIPQTTRERAADRAAASLAHEEAEGRLLAVRGRTVALFAVGVLLFFTLPMPAVLFYEVLLAIFVLLGFVRLQLDRSGVHRWWLGSLLTTLDFAFLAFTLVVPNPLDEVELPRQFVLRFGNFVYFYVLLAGLTIGFQPRQLLWSGIIGALVWIAAVAWIISLPDTVLAPVAMEHTLEAVLATVAQPTFVDIDMVVRDVGVFLIVAALLALVVSRSRRLVLRQAMLERERGNLARYFPPATVDRLARQDVALAQIREQEVAVLFADIVGFTHWSERHAPAEVIALLRDVHARLEEAVFRHHGTVDKFIGDGMMATFGTPDQGPRDAVNALACLRAIIADFKVFAARRRWTGNEPIRISLGLHYGSVVVGNIGTERRLELAVLGDTVNVAYRLEALTRALGVTAVVSAAAADASRREAPAEAAELLKDADERGAQHLRGRDAEVGVLTFG